MRGISRGRAEAPGVEAGPAPREPEALRRLGEACRQQVGVGARAGHAGAEVGVVEPACAHPLQQRNHPLRPVGRVDREPFQEERPHLERQTQQHVARAACASIARRFEDRFHLVVGETGDDGRHHHAYRHSCRAERAHRLQPLCRRGRARLHGAGEAAVERRDRERDRREPAPCHAREDVRIAGDQRRLGDDADGMLVAVEHLEHAPCQRETAFGRLVGVGVRAHRDHPAFVAGTCQLALQLGGRIVLGEDAALEILPRREAEKGVGGARVAIDAAVLAAAIDVDRTVEAEIGRGVARDHRAAGIGSHLGAERRLGFVDGAPAVVERVAQVALVAPARIARSPPSLAHIPHRRSIGRG